MANILIVNTIIPPPFIGGAERSMLNIGQEMIEQGHSVFYFGLLGPGNLAQMQELDSGGVAYRAPIRNLYWPWDQSAHRGGLIGRVIWHLQDVLAFGMRRTVRRLFDEVRPDVVLTNNLRGHALVPWKVAQERGLPIIHFVRDYGLICIHSTMYKRLKNCDSPCGECKLRTFATKCGWPGGTVVGVSESVVDRHLKAGLFEGATRYVSYPSVGDIFSDKSTDQSVPSYKSMFGYLGRVDEEKGVDTMSAAADRANVLIDVAGSPGTFRISTDRLNLIGVDRADRFLANHSVLVVPSNWREPFGRVVAEAAKFRVKVIISDAPGLVEAAKQSGCEYRTFRAGDADDLGALLDSASNGTIEWDRASSPTRGTSVSEIVRAVLIDTAK